MTPHDIAYLNEYLGNAAEGCTVLVYLNTPNYWTSYYTRSEINLSPTQKAMLVYGGAAVLLSGIALLDQLFSSDE